MLVRRARRLIREEPAATTRAVVKAMDFKGRRVAEAILKTSNERDERASRRSNRGSRETKKILNKIDVENTKKPRKEKKRESQDFNR